MQTLSKILLMITALAGTATAAHAQSNASTGTINLSLSVAASCAVNGGSAGTPNLGTAGTITFPNQSGTFGDVTGTLVAAGNGAGISVLCSPGAIPTLTIGSGAHDASSLHHLASNGQQIAYHLFSDAALSNEIGIGQQIALGTAGSTAIVQPIYARVSSGGAMLPAGTYVDTVQVTLSW